ncbi:UNVERIFIED_CONTAM: hypothetical protein Sradi_6214800 [Sesamum radiatum]|uniref:Reverse transcriptase-like protein n=1 Tax=Sesamum radiatum TaxID=300843 RepID=A0AAW2K9E7_SESRA
MELFKEWEIELIPRSKNSKADELARMGSHLEDIDTTQITLLTIQLEGKTKEVQLAKEVQTESWIDEIQNYVESGKLSEERNETKKVKKLAG